MCDKIRPFQGASETTENGYKWSEKSEGYVFIPNIVDQNVKKTHPAGFENTAIPQFKIKITEIPHEKLANTAIPQTPTVPLKKVAYTYKSASHPAMILRKTTLLLP